MTRTANPPEELRFRPIGRIRSCFKEKFGIPRQPGLAPDARAVLELDDPDWSREAVRGLESFSHVWVVWVFHEGARDRAPSLVRPPRLGGARKVGVYATRSPHRPNPIGISAVALERVEAPERGPVRLHLRGGDFLDGTPVLDVKPYLPYADAITDAGSGWAEGRPARLRVTFVPEALEAIGRTRTEHPEALALIEQIVGEDPRPAFQASRATGVERYASRILDFDVHWAVTGGECVVTGIRAPAPASDARS